MYGARISLVVALTGTLIAGVIGTLLGVLAGYMGKWWDQFIMRITDAWLTMPSLVFAILLSSVRGPGLWNIVIILAAVFWSRYARVARGEVLAIRERLREARGDQWREKAQDHFSAHLAQRHQHRDGGVQLTGGSCRDHRGLLSFLGVGVPRLNHRGDS